MFAPLILHEKERGFCQRLQPTKCEQHRTLSQKPYVYHLLLFELQKRLNRLKHLSKSNSYKNGLNCTEVYLLQSSVSHLHAAKKHRTNKCSCKKTVVYKKAKKKEEHGLCILVCHFFMSHELDSALCYAAPYFCCILSLSPLRYHSQQGSILTGLKRRTVPRGPALPQPHPVRLWHRRPTHRPRGPWQQVPHRNSLLQCCEEHNRPQSHCSTGEVKPSALHAGSGSGVSAVQWFCMWQQEGLQILHCI